MQSLNLEQSQDRVGINHSSLFSTALVALLLMGLATHFVRSLTTDGMEMRRIAIETLGPRRIHPLVPVENIGERIAALDLQ